MTVHIENGDCLELMAKLPDKSVDLFICDLPYGETNCSWDSKIDLVKFWAEFKRLRKHTRVACIHFCSTKFGYTLIKSNPSLYKMDMVWKKRNKTGGLQSRLRPMRNHEMVYFFYEQSPKYNRDKYHKRIQAKPKLPSSVIEETCSGAEFGWETHKLPKENRGNEGYDPRLPCSMFESGKVFVGKRNHQTEKPLDILEFFLKYYTDEGDTVLDPTMGSGSVGVACAKLNRNFIGYELTEKYFEVAKNRIEKKK